MLDHEIKVRKLSRANWQLMKQFCLAQHDLAQEGAETSHAAGSVCYTELPILALAAAEVPRGLA